MHGRQYVEPLTGIVEDRLKPAKSHPDRLLLEGLAAELREALGDLKGDLILDLGAAQSPYRSLANGFHEFVTADLPGFGADHTIDSDSGRVSLADGSVDCVLSTQVLEHVPDPAAYLSEARRLLRPEGTLVLSTNGVYPYHRSPDDYWRWTGPGLRLQVERAGFAVERVKPVVSGVSASASMLCRFVAGPLPRPLRRVFLRLTQTLLGALESILPARVWRDAAVFVVTATRQP